jgi:hypothetical protein
VNLRAFRSSVGPTRHPRRGESGCSPAVTPSSGFRPAEPADQLRIGPKASAETGDCSHGVSLPSTLEHQGIFASGCQTTRLSVLRVSHPLDGLILPGTFGLVSCRNALGIHPSGVCPRRQVSAAFARRVPSWRFRAAIASDPHSPHPPVPKNRRTRGAAFKALLRRRIRTRKRRLRRTASRSPLGFLPL